MPALPRLLPGRPGTRPRVPRARPLRLALLAAALAAGGVRAAPEEAPLQVMRCVLHGTVNAGSADYLGRCVQEAERSGASALLVRMDTPGGALESTRLIVQAFLRSPVPILVWVGPAGARAGSAGVFITLAAHVAAMAPATHIGAAHPVEGLSGADPGGGNKAMGEKVLNDVAAFAEAIARQRGRNVEWAVQAVRESASIEASVAVQKRVVDLVAATEEALLAEVHGRKVQTASGEEALRTRGAAWVDLAPTTRQRLLHWLANPALAYLLFLVGSLGLAAELSHPGLVVPGLLGVVCLVLALVAFSALPIVAAAVVLLVLGVALIVAELFVAHGLLGAGGVLLLVVGGAFLVDPTAPGWLADRSFALPLRLIVPTAVVLGGMAAFVAVRSAQTRRLAPLTGDAGMVGEVGRALTPFVDGQGEVFVHGERWRARSERPLAPGTAVVVRRVEGLTLHVEQAQTPEKPWI